MLEPPLPPRFSLSFFFFISTVSLSFLDEAAFGKRGCKVLVASFLEVLCGFEFLPPSWADTLME